MNLTLLQRQLQNAGREVAQYVNISQSIKTLGFTALAVGLILPFGSPQEIASAHSQDLVTDKVSMTRDFQLVERTAAITVVQSQAQIAASQRQKVKAINATAIALPRVVIANVSQAEKDEWVQKAASAYGIRPELLQAVWQIESGQTWYTYTRSYAGATGPLQFMPGTWRKYAADGNGDGRMDINDARDALFGAAKLLAANGANRGQEEKALFAYNHSSSYVKKVLSIAASMAD